MTQTIQAKDINLRYLIDKFGIQLVLDDSLFPEWQENLPGINDLVEEEFRSQNSGVRINQSGIQTRD